MLKVYTYITQIKVQSTIYHFLVFIAYEWKYEILDGMGRNWSRIGTEIGTETTRTNQNWDRKLLEGHSVPPNANSGTFRPILAETKLTTIGGAYLSDRTTLSKIRIVKVCEAHLLKTSYSESQETNSVWLS